MRVVDFGAFLADIPDDWSDGDDDNLMAIYPPDGDSYIQISTYRGPDDHVPSARELWESAEGSLEEAWAVSQTAIQRSHSGFALDAGGPATGGGALQAFRLWPGRLVFATFYYSAEGAKYVDDASAILASLRPAAS